MNVPEFVRRWLVGLSDEEADELWVWLDSMPHAASELIEVLCLSHPNISAVPEYWEQRKVQINALSK